MSEFLFSTSQLYMSDFERLESYIEEELISPNVAFLTKFMVAATLGIVVTVLVKLYLNGNDNFWPDHGVPLVKESEGSSLLDLLRGSSKRHHNRDKAVYAALGEAKYGGLMEFGRPVLLVKDLDLARKILVSDHFDNPSELSIHERLLCSNKLCSDIRIRNVATSLFTPANFFRHFNSCAAQLVEFIRSESATEESRADGINISECFERYTMDVISTSCFGVVDSSSLLEKSGFYKYGKMCRHSSSPWRLAKVFQTLLPASLEPLFPISFIEQKSTHFFKNIVEQAINHRENNEKGHNRSTELGRQDLLQLLRRHTRDKEMKIDEPELEVDSFESEAQFDHDDDDDSGTVKPTPSVNDSLGTARKVYLTDELILAQSLLVGLEATVSLLAFASYALAVHPDCQERLWEEVERCLSETGELDHDSVNSMQYLDMFVNETLRMYPPAARLERRCTKEEYQVVDLDIKLRLPKEVLVVIPVIAFHHDEKHFPDAPHFTPERWLSPAKRKIHPYSYIPFGYGPRNCIAARFAVAEAKAAIAHLVHNFIIEPAAATPIPMEYDNFSQLLRPVRMMKIRFRPRK